MFETETQNPDAVVETTPAPASEEAAKVENTYAEEAAESESQQRPALTSGLEYAPKDDLPFESHFTVRIPTSTLQYRGQLLRVVDTDDDQIILSQVEDDKEKKILVKRISPESAGQKVLRISYTLVTILFVSFLFVFAFQVLLFLMTALPVYSGMRTGASGEISVIAIISTLLAFPLMIHGMSSLMALGSGKG